MARRHLAWIAPLVLIVLAAGRDAALLFRYPVAVGVNGYYYVLQIDQLANSGRFYFSSSTPFILYALTAFSYLIPNLIVSIKIASLLTHVLLCLGIFGVIQTTLRNLWFSILGIALAAIPQSHLYMTTEYINQLGALVFLVWAGWSLILSAQARRRITLLIVSFVLLVAAFFSHKSALVFAPAIATCVLLVFALGHSAMWKMSALIVILVAWLSPAIVSAQPFFTVPEWLQSQLSFRPHWPLEADLLAEELMLIIAASAVLFFVISPKSKSRTRAFNLVFGSVALFSLLVTLNPFFNAQEVMSGVAGRARMFSYIQVALLAPAVIWLVYSHRRKAAIYAGAVFVPLVVISALEPLPYGLRADFLVRRQILIESLKVHASEITKNSMIVAPHGDQFVVTATIAIPSAQRPPANANYDVVYWMLNHVRDPSLLSDSIQLMPERNAATILVEDPLLKRRFAEMDISERLSLVRGNPHLAKALPVLGEITNKSVGQSIR